MDDSAASICPDCLKSPALCQCATVSPVENRVFLLILQHPQEQDRDLGTARLAMRFFAHSALKVGLSWPNLAKALERNADPKKWGVLYLGPAQIPPDAPRGIIALDRAGTPMPDAASALAGLDGIVLLDGTWSQAKALWWRNAWLLKLRRLVLHTGNPSLYGKLRKEPRRESVSTLEAIAFAMSRLEHNPALETRLVASFRTLLQRYRDRRKNASGHPAAPAA